MTPSKRFTKPRILIFSLLTAIVIAAIVIFVIISSKSQVTDYQPTEKDNENLAWMSKLDDAKMLSELSIPGTHNAGATKSFMGISGKCQDTSIKEQLYIGVRFLDIRLMLEKDKLKVVHSFVDQDLSFESVLENITSFIAENPTEFLIVSIKQEADPENSTVSFASKVEEMLLQHDCVSGDRNFPKTLGEARGKILILSRYENASIGVPAYHGWMDSASFEIGELYVQDKYKITDIAQKTEAFENALNIAAEMKYSLVMNYASCYLENAWPPMSASKTAKEINPYLLKTLKDVNTPFGVILCDFITEDMCEVIIQNNLK